MMGWVRRVGVFGDAISTSIPGTHVRPKGTAMEHRAFAHGSRYPDSAVDRYVA